VMGGSDGGAGGPLAFDADRCYGMGISIRQVLPDNIGGTTRSTREVIVHGGGDGESQ
jgi:hypothetical protein